MSDLVLYHHPYSRAATVVWMLEEVGRPYRLVYVDLKAGEQRAAEHRRRNPMGKIPVLLDGEVIVTEVAAIGLYLADRYAHGTLAPTLDSPDRGTYFRWSCFAPSVIEPAAAAKASQAQFNPGSVGWGDYDSMVSTLEHALGRGPWLLGERFSMADVILGSTLRYMLRFKMVEPRPSFLAYGERLASRPALVRAEERNAAIVRERGLG